VGPLGPAAIGRGDPLSAKQSGWLAVWLGAGFMQCAAVVFLSISRQLISLLPAVFQIFDGVQVAATCILRGAGGTRTLMLVNLVGLLGLPAGYLLCFVLGYGVTGLWIGLSVGLIVDGSILLIAWSRLRLQSFLAAPQRRVGEWHGALAAHQG
jgi:multidrug resistance protein, MATE family